MEWSRAIPPRRVHVGAAVEQDLGEIREVRLGGGMKRGLTVIARRVHLRAAVEEQRGDLDARPGGGFAERRRGEVVHRERGNHRLAGRPVQRGLADVVGGVPVGAVVQEAADGFGVPPLCRLVKQRVRVFVFGALVVGHGFRSAPWRVVPVSFIARSGEHRNAIRRTGQKPSHQTTKGFPVTGLSRHCRAAGARRCAPTGVGPPVPHLR